MPYATDYLRAAACDIAGCILLNESAQVDPITRRILDGNNSYLRRQLAGIRQEMKLPEHMQRMGEYGPNGRGPGIEDMIRMSAHHRERGVVVQLEAAE